MVNFAELKAKAERAKDVSITKVTNTRDRYSSTPSSKTNWDPNWKRVPPTSTSRGGPPPPPPPPSRSRPDAVALGTDTVPPTILRTLRPTDDVPAPSTYTPPPPPTRVVSGYPPSHQETSQDAVNKIDWVNLSPEDKEEFFEWLDEFFSRYLGIELSPRERRSVPLSASATLPVARRSPPTVNMTTRPQV